MSKTWIELKKEGDEISIFSNRLILKVKQNGYYDVRKYYQTKNQRPD